MTWKATTTAAAALAMAIMAAPAAHAGTTPPPDKKQHGAEVGSPIDASLWGDDTTREGKQASKGPGSWDGSQDLGSTYSLTKNGGIQAAWARGYTGHDVTVAVVDTGIAPVPGLDRDDKVVDGPDLSYDGQAAGTRYIDGYGHGTHVAGIIAGEDDHFDPKKPLATQFDGVAPEARLLNMKVGASDGGTDVSQVIAALDWVVEHRNDQGMHVRVVNLAYGTESVQPWQVDPLARAVESAWDAGIVVVTAAGNDGLGSSSLLMPAMDPHVLAVGAVDHHGTESTADDTVADFTNGGSSDRRPDVLAPGKSVVSLRVPGSYIDVEHPEGLVAGDDSGRFFRGSGTSQATAVVSGEVALLLQAKPQLTPDQVKALLMGTADPLQSGQPAMGAGVVDVTGAIDVATGKVAAPAAVRGVAGRQAALPDSSGTGSIEASRGGEHVVDPSTGDTLVGEYDALGHPWNGAAWASSSADGTSWNKGLWNGQVWTTDKWKDRQVVAAAWPGASWDGVAWSDHQWSDDTWEARGWRARSWRARSWREESWQARSWRGMD